MARSQKFVNENVRLKKMKLKLFTIQQIYHQTGRKFELFAFQIFLGNKNLNSLTMLRKSKNYTENNGIYLIYS